jgi:hypothetical protein
VCSGVAFLYTSIKIATQRSTRSSGSGGIDFIKKPKTGNHRDQLLLIVFMKIFVRKLFQQVFSFISGDESSLQWFLGHFEYPETASG